MKFCVSQFKGPHVTITKAEGKNCKDTLVKAKGYDELTELVGSWSGEDDFAEIVEAIKHRRLREHLPSILPDLMESSGFLTPPVSRSLSQVEPGAPRIPSNGQIPPPAIVTGSDAVTPSPTPGGSMSNVLL
jgi:tRNA-dihydrouridine synthase 2